jgi:tetratricopeptide (TPR) repeat protein
LSEFEIAARLNPNHPGVRLEIANDLRELGRLDSAEATVNGVLENDPDSFEAHVGLAHINRQQGDRQSSLSEFEIAARLNPNHPGVRLEIANDLRELDKLDSAEAIVSQVLEQDPDNFEAHVGLAHIKRRRGDRHGSLSELQIAARLNPRHPGVRLEIASDLREFGLLADAERSIRSALELNPRYANAYGQLGILHRVRGRFQEARQAFERAAACEAGNLSFRIECANCDRELGSLAEAEAALRAIVSECPDQVQASTSLATLLIEAYRLDEAKTVLEKIFDCKPCIDVVLVLGRLYRRADQRSNALELFQRAYELDPGNRGALSELIEEYRAAGRFTEAQKTTEDLAKRDILAALLCQGRIFRDKGEHRFALDAFKATCAAYPDATQALLELAVQYRLVGQPQQAKRILDSILASNPGNLSIIDQIIE